VGLTLRDSGGNAKRSIEASGFVPEVPCGFEMPLLLVEQSAGPDRVCEVEKSCIEMATVDLQGLFVERLGFREISLLLVDIRNVADGMSAGQEVVLLAMEPGAFGIELAGGGKIALLTGLIPQSNSLRRGSHDEGRIYPPYRPVEKSGQAKQAPGVVSRKLTAQAGGRSHSSFDSVWRRIAPNFAQDDTLGFPTDLQDGKLQE
jgi:hypothetical protein